VYLGIDQWDADPVKCIEHAKRTTVVVYLLELDSKHIHTHPFNGLLSGATRVSWYQKGKTNLDFTEARDSEWQ